MPFRYVAVAAVFTTLTGCTATTSTTRDERIAATEETDCLWLRTVTDWEALDERNLIVEGAGNRPYHVQLAQSCFGIEFETMIGFYDRSGDERICGFGMDRVVVDNALPETCWITAVDALTEDQAEELVLRYERDQAVRRN